MTFRTTCSQTYNKSVTEGQSSFKAERDMTDEMHTHMIRTRGSAGTHQQEVIAVPREAAQGRERSRAKPSFAPHLVVRRNAPDDDAIILAVLVVAGSRRDVDDVGTGDTRLVSVVLVVAVAVAVAAVLPGVGAVAHCVGLVSRGPLHGGTSVVFLTVGAGGGAGGSGGIFDGIRRACSHLLPGRAEK